MQVDDSVLQKGTSQFGTAPSALHSLGGMDGAVYDFEREGQLLAQCLDLEGAAVESLGQAVTRM